MTTRIYTFIGEGPSREAATAAALLLVEVWMNMVGLRPDEVQGFDGSEKLDRLWRCEMVLYIDTDRNLEAPEQ